MSEDKETGFALPLRLDTQACIVMNEGIVLDANYKVVATFFTVEEAEEFIAEAYVEVYEGKRYPIGIQGAIDHVLGVRSVYPDLKITIENQISEGEWVATAYSVTGTFKQEWFVMKTTGKPIT